MQDVSPERLRRFFVEEEGGYRDRQVACARWSFSRGKIFLSDPPFSRMDLVSCRNLLIYLEPSLQKKMMPTFHYALKPEGFLFLGASESIGGFTDLFEPVDKKHKIYSKKAAHLPAFQLPVRTGARRGPATTNRDTLPTGRGTKLNWRLAPNSTRNARPTASQSQILSARRAHQCRTANPAIPRADRRLS